MKSKIINILLILFPIIIIELLSQIIFLSYGFPKYSILLKPFANVIQKNIKENITDNNPIKWDFSRNKMMPGKYKRKNDKGTILNEYTINTQGFRGKEFNLITKKKRIITLGGSTTIGVESADNETYPAHLELLLNKNTANYEVLNMGFGSKSLNFIKSLLFSEAYKYNPNIIIIYSNRNSILYDGSNIDPKIDSRLIKLNYFLQENIMAYGLLLKIYKRIINVTTNTNFLKSPYGSVGISQEYLNSGYKNSLIEIIKFCEKNNIKVILVKQAYYFNPNISAEIDNFSISQLVEIYKNDYLIKKYNVEETANFWLILGTILNKKLDELKNFDNVIIVNPIPKLLQDKSNFTDYLHLTPQGNFVLANEIYKSIK
jgi:lysophospholipase L1-like esterase